MLRDQLGSCSLETRLCSFSTMDKSRKSHTTEFKMKAIARLHELENNIQIWPAQENELRHLKVRIKNIIAIPRGSAVICSLPKEASGGWLSRFLRRSGLAYRRATTHGQGMPANAANVTKKFLRDAKTAMNNLDPNAVANMDYQRVTLVTFTAALCFLQLYC